MKHFLKMIWCAFWHKDWHTRAGYAKHFIPWSCRKCGRAWRENLCSPFWRSL